MPSIFVFRSVHFIAEILYHLDHNIKWAFVKISVWFLSNYITTPTKVRSNFASTWGVNEFLRLSIVYRLKRTLVKCLLVESNTVVLRLCLNEAFRNKLGMSGKTYYSHLFQGHWRTAKFRWICRSISVC